MKITSLLFWVQENTLSVKFYKKLGFEVVHSDEFYSVVGLDGFEVQLVNIRQDEQFGRDSMSSHKGEGMYIYIQVEDVEKEYERQIAHGLEPATYPKTWEWGNKEFILRDPDGYKLCFWQKALA